jgi:hypothetical protein
MTEISSSPSPTSASPGAEDAIGDVNISLNQPSADDHDPVSVSEDQD